MERVSATYLIGTPIDPADAAEATAGEQSSGTFDAVPGETAELKARFGARVETVTEVEAASRPSLPGAAQADRYRRAHVTISWPLETVGVSLPGVLATVASDLFELRQVSGLKILDLEFPAAFAGRYEGPRFGVEGTRRLAGVAGRPKPKRSVPPVSRHNAATIGRERRRLSSPPAGPSKVRSRRPEVGSHSLIFASKLPEDRMLRPLGENATDNTPSWCASKLCISRPVATFQSAGPA